MSGKCMHMSEGSRSKQQYSALGVGPSSAFSTITADRSLPFESLCKSTHDALHHLPLPSLSFLLHLTSPYHCVVITLLQFQAMLIVLGRAQLHSS
jgi:hypothetical protein